MIADGCEQGGDAAFHRRVLDSVADNAILALDLDGRVTLWSEGARQVVGWTEAEMLGASAERLFTPEDVAAGRLQASMRQTLQTGRSAGERWLVRKDGARFWASGEMTLLRAADGRPEGFVKVLRDRTEEHAERAALSVARARLSHAQRAGGVGMFVVDLAADEMRPTAEFCRLCGMEPRERVPVAEMEALVVEEDRPLLSDTASRLRGDFPPDVEYRIRRADTGALRWLARTGQVERDAEGRAVRFVGVARDITARREEREALVRSEERYRALFNAVDDGFCIIEFAVGDDGTFTDYTHVEANAGYERHTGITDVVGRTLRQIAPGDAAAWLELYGEVLRTGKPIRFERRFAEVGRDIEVSASRIEPPERRLVSVLFRDVTARNAAEADARGNRERVQLALTAGAIAGTWHWNLRTGAFTIDEGFARAFGREGHGGRVGVKPRDLVASVHPDDVGALTAAIEEAMRRGGAYAHQYRARRADGRYTWVEANGRVDMGADGRPENFLGVLLDVEERRAVEAERDRAAADLRALNDTLEQQVAARTAELMQAEEQLRQSQKLEAVGQLTGGVAHDFNNLLTIIRSSTDFLKREDLPAARRRRYVDAISETVERAAKLTSQLLAFARRQPLKPEVFDVGARVRDVSDLIRPLMGARIVIEVSVDARGLHTQADISQFETALVNLAVNARDAMEGEGRLTFSVAPVDHVPAIRGHAGAAGEFLAVSVADTGPGIAADRIADIFEPFYTTKEVGKGTGLGLSQVFGFTKQSGGEVDVRSTPGRGAVFTLYLPRCGAEAVAAAADTRAPAHAPPPRGVCVLVVEDNETVGRFADEMLRDLGYRTHLVGNAREALDVLEPDGRGFDVVFSDVIMPGVNGVELAREVRSRWPALPVVLTSGYSNVLAQEGAHGFELLRKPYSIDELSLILRSVTEAPQVA